MLFAYGSIKKHPPVRGKHDFAHDNIMNMNVLKIAALAVTIVSAGCSRQTVGEDEYLIKGVVRNIPDNTVMSLISRDGRLAVRVTQDLSLIQLVRGRRGGEGDYRGDTRSARRDGGVEGEGR